MFDAMDCIHIHIQIKSFCPQKKINIMVFPAGCRLLINVTIGPHRTLLYFALIPYD